MASVLLTRVNWCCVVSSVLLPEMSHNSVCLCICLLAFMDEIFIVIIGDCFLLPVNELMMIICNSFQL